MNERIKKSYVQALAKCAKDLSKNGEDVDIPVDVFAEKFAQLIVQECMQLNRDILCEDDPDYLDQIYREHFGLE